jgi:hypothetical protein
MSHGAKTQREKPGRIALRGIAACPTRFSGISRAFIQRSRLSDRHGTAVQRQQQRETGRVRQGHETPRLGQQHDHSQSQARIDRGRVYLRNQEGAQAEQGKLVCSDMADTGLVTGDGCAEGRLHPERLSENKFRPPENGVEGHRIAPENGVAPPLLPQKMVLSGTFFPSRYSIFWRVSRYCHLYWLSRGRGRAMSETKNCMGRTNLGDSARRADAIAAPVVVLGEGFLLIVGHLAIVGR